MSNLSICRTIGSVCASRMRALVIAYNGLGFVVVEHPAPMRRATGICHDFSTAQRPLDFARDVAVASRGLFPVIVDTTPRGRFPFMEPGGGIGGAL